MEAACWNLPQISIMLRRIKTIHQHIHRHWKGAIAPLLLGALLVTLLARSAQAQTSLLNSKVAQLEFNVHRLETRLSQLESQRSGIQRSGARPSLAQSTPEPRQAQRPGAVSREEFSNLATLVIELKQEVIQLRESQPAFQR